jgi:hypothetical protein
LPRWSISLAVFLLIGDSVMGKSAGENFTQVNQQLFSPCASCLHSAEPQGLVRYMQELNQPEARSTAFAMQSGRDLVTGRIIRDDPSLGRERATVPRRAQPDHHGIAL